MASNKAWKQQPPALYDTMTAHFVDDPRSASVSTSTDPLVVDILHGDDGTTAFTISSHHNDNHAHHADTDSAAAATCDWQYVWDEVR
jgi:hypothetical protein